MKNNYDNDIKISIIIPVYNAFPFIKTCINSIATQINAPQFEVICIDDCSTDESYSYLVSTAKSLLNLKVLRNTENKGVSFARNRGLDEAIGEYILFVDSDDALAPDTLKSCYQFAKKTQSDIVCFQVKCFSDEGVSNFFDDNTVSLLKKIRNGHPEYIFYITNLWSLFYKRNIIEKNRLRFSDKRIFEDWEFLWSLYAKKPVCQYLNKTLYYYRVNSNTNSLTTIFRKRKWKFSTLVEAANTSLSSLKELPDYEKYEYCCLQRTLQILFHFFINSKLKFSELCEDVAAFSTFLDSENAFMVNKIIRDTFHGTHRRIMIMIGENTAKNRLILYVVLNSGASHYFMEAKNCWNSIIYSVSKVIIPLKSLLINSLGLGRNLLKGFFSLIMNVITKLNAK